MCGRQMIITWAEVWVGGSPHLWLSASSLSLPRGLCPPHAAVWTLTRAHWGAAQEAPWRPDHVGVYECLHALSLGAEPRVPAAPRDYAR